MTAPRLEDEPSISGGRWFKKKKRRTSEDSKRRTYLSIFINPRQRGLKNFLTILSRPCESAISLSYPFVILFALLPRPCCISATAKRGRYNDLQLYSTALSRLYSLLRPLFTCAPLPSIGRNDAKKEHMPRFVLINCSTCAGLQFSVGSCRHWANKCWKSDSGFRIYGASKNILPEDFGANFLCKIL